jgi:Secretion system C-terminal sorting domain
MKKNNTKYLLVLISAINILFIIQPGRNFANDKAPKYISGKVIYADTKSPVADGMIKVFMINDLTNQGSILETTPIESNGEFRLIIQPFETDGVKIMAYPNDYDNLESPFEPKVIDEDKIFSSGNNEYSVTIEVNRIDNNVIKSQGTKRSGEENNFALKQNFPNPFNPTTLIRFELPEASRVTLKVYNMSGESVATIVDNKYLHQGLNEFEFNAISLPSGIYAYSLNAGNYTETRKMMLLK